MKAGKCWVVGWLLAVVPLMANHQIVRCAPLSDVPAAEPGAAVPNIVGLWQATTVSMTTPDGSRKTLAEADSRFNVAISATRLTMRVRDKLLSDMSYVLNAKQTPWAIDLKSADGAMLGICQRKADRLRISLNDQAKGRPHNFRPKENGMVLELTRFPVRSLFMINANGSGRRRILTMWDNTITGSPDWSHDGKRIALDAWKSIYGEGAGDACMLVVNVDGTGRKDLGPGYMPCWSLDDKQLAFSSNQPERGICIMKADGSDRHCIDPEGWGAQWSPKRNEIAYTHYRDGRADLCIYDLGKRQRRDLLDRDYRQIYHQLTWSPDGNWLCFNGTRPDGSVEIAAVSRAGEKQGFTIVVPASWTAAFESVGGGPAWGGDGEQIIFTGQSKGSRLSRMYLVDFKDGKPPRLFPGLPDDWNIGTMVWSPDGKKLAFCAFPGEKR